jgi:hypothetical protein
LRLLPPESLERAQYVQSWHHAPVDFSCSVFVQVVPLVFPVKALLLHPSKVLPRSPATAVRPLSLVNGLRPPNALPLISMESQLVPIDVLLPNEVLLLLVLRLLVDVFRPDDFHVLDDNLLLFHAVLSIDFLLPPICVPNSYVLLSLYVHLLRDDLFRYRNLRILRAIQFFAIPPLLLLLD